MRGSISRTIGGLRATETVDAVVVGGGHHGLVAAARLADAGWDVVLLEANDHVGGAVDSVERDGWILDAYSACHPLALASPVLQSLNLEEHGLRWAKARTHVAHLGRPGAERAPAVFDDPHDTAALLAEDDPRDGRTWMRLVEQYAEIKGPLLDAILLSWPPVTDGARLLGRIGLRGLPDFLRFALLPTTRMGEELFVGSGGRELLAGNAMHADAPPTAAVSGMYGWLMTMLAQDVGFPSPVGGTRELARALARRAQAAGARIDVSTRATRIVVRDGHARGVETADGRRIAARRAVIADTSAPALYLQLLDQDVVPAGLAARLRQFQWDLPTVKLNYRLAAPMPWTAQQARGAGVIHVGRDVPGLVQWSSDLETGTVPESPFALIGQMTSIDSTRSPAGTEAMWLYTHAPRGMATAGPVVVERAEQMLDGYAPGWRDLVLERWVQGPGDLHEADHNLGDGGVGGGTQQLFQQVIWRPAAGLGGPRTPVRGLYLGSAATHPGGGVHGGAGHMAAMAALHDARLGGLMGTVVGGTHTALLRGLYSDADPAWVGQADHLPPA